MDKNINEKELPKKHFEQIEIVHQIKEIIEKKEYTWEKDGKKIMRNKIIFSNKDKIKLHSLLLTPMPNEMRKDFWLIASGAKRELINNPKYYENLTKNYPSNLIPSPYDYQIDLDLNRTFPEDNFFKDEKIINKLKNILLAYSRRNISVGYSQGFNFIVGKILKIIDNEEEAFWLFTQLIEFILPIDFYYEGCGLMVDCSILMKILEKTNEELSEHFSSLGLDLILSNILFKWMLSLFTENCNHNIMIKIWDCLLLDGDIVLFKACIGLLRVMTNDIIKTKKVEKIMSIFQSDTYLDSILDLDIKMDYFLLIKKYSFDKELICHNRSLIFPKVKKSIQKLDKKPIKKFKGEKCNLKWNFCIDNLDKYNITHYSVFKEMNEPNVIENYYFGNSKFSRKKYNRYNSKEEIYSNNLNKYSNEEIFENLLIERTSHRCKKCKNKMIKNKAINQFKSSNNLFFINPLNIYNEIHLDNKKSQGEIIEEISKEIDIENLVNENEQRAKQNKEYEELFNEYEYNLDFY